MKKRMTLCMLVAGSVMLASCGKEADKSKDVAGNPTVATVDAEDGTGHGGNEEDNNTGTLNEENKATDANELNGESDSGTSTDATEETTEDSSKEAGMEGFYHYVSGDNVFVRTDFEMKETTQGYRGLFYAQYTEVTNYEAEEILSGTKISDTEVEFKGEDTVYRVTWDGADKITVEGGDFGGTYERVEPSETMDADYPLPVPPNYEADTNVEAGIELDATLAREIRKELGFEESHTLTYADLESVTYIAPFNITLTSITGISLLKNLQECHFDSSYIYDLEEMTQLKSLRSVSVNHCYVMEIPDFSGCENLESLYLGNNLIEDVTPVTKIKSLKYLDLNVNRIKSIEPLKEMTGLETLCIEQNCILDYDRVKDADALIQAYNSGAQGSFENALALENRTKEIVDSFPKGVSELELEKMIYRYIKDNMVYEINEGNGEAYGYYGIMTGKGVCGDYADAFSLLANHAGLEAITCSSEDHAWNIVKVDGVYYHCDALWDEDVTEWSHFNKSTGYMYNLESHTHDLRRFPICESSMSVLEYCDWIGGGSENEQG